MLFFPVLTFATLAISAVSAAPVARSDNGVFARDDLYAFRREIEFLEARGPDKHKETKKYVPPPPPKVTFDKSAENNHRPDKTLDKLDLHGDSRKKVEDYHRQVVENHMETVPGAHTGVVKQLAHSKGSRDPNIHVSAEIKNKAEGVIPAPRRGNPAVMDPTHHIYTNPEDPSKGYHVLPKEYKKAVDRHNKIAGQPTGEGSI